MATREALVKGLIRRRYARHAGIADGRHQGRRRAIDLGYVQSELETLPDRVVDGFAGCGNPLAGLALDQARVILDLGAGTGLDSRLAARRADPESLVIAADITPEMLAGPCGDAHACARLAADFERLPLRDDCCDLVIANAALNLALDPDKAYAEIWRVLRPGGRLHICDLVRTEPPEPDLIADPLGWSTSLGGVLYEPELARIVRNAGFVDVEIGGHRAFAPVVAITLDGRKPPVRSGIRKPSLEIFGPQVSHAV